MNIYIVSGMVPQVTMPTIIIDFVPFVIAEFLRLSIYFFLATVVLYLFSLR